MAETSLLMNRYELQQPIGTGGMAVVYRASDLMLERPVAIKILRSDLSQDEAFRERFRQEAKAVANLSHPNIVTVYDFGLDGDWLFIVMEFVPGTDLKTLLKQQGVFQVEKALSLLTQACAGIGYAHRAGLVHCDVKPHNILVTQDGRVKVTDFGIARALTSIRPDEKSDVVWGSPQYFSPEQAGGNAPSPASDVYSLGVILYEMLTGRLPFTSTDPSELARMHAEVTPQPPIELNPAIPENLNRIVMKVLSKEPSARYRTADQLGQVLKTYTPALETLAAPAATANPVSAPAPTPMPELVYIPQQAAVPDPEIDREETFDFDWITISMGLLAVLAVGGLIPFWLYVWFYLNPIVK